MHQKYQNTNIKPEDELNELAKKPKIKIKITVIMLYYKKKNKSFTHFDVLTQ